MSDLITHPKIAKSAVVDMSRTEPRGCFRVDDEPFPWWLSEEGPTARKLKDDLYAVHVSIFVVSAEAETLPETFYHEGLTNGWDQPVLQGIEFPWCITADGFTYSSRGSREVPTVELEFFAESVEGMPVTDETELPDDGRVFSATGCVIARLPR